MTTIRIGARSGSVREMLSWLNDNVGKFIRREITGSGTVYTGENWNARWRQFGGGWFMDVTFNDPKYATIFSLRWK